MNHCASRLHAVAVRARQTRAAESYGNAGHTMRARERKPQEDQFEAGLFLFALVRYSGSKTSVGRKSGFMKLCPGGTERTTGRSGITPLFGRVLHWRIRRTTATARSRPSPVRAEPEFLPRVPLLQNKLVAANAGSNRMYEFIPRSADQNFIEDKNSRREGLERCVGAPILIEFDKRILANKRSQICIILIC